METEDGEIVEESKYNEMIDALTRHNVQLVDANGEYRKTYDIIKDIAAVWKDMSTMQQAAVVEALAGTRQQNIFASLMTQFGEAEEAIERMKDSAGELEEAYQIRMDSIQAHIDTMRAAYVELSRDFVDTKLAKGAIDLLTKLIEALDAIINEFGVLGVVMGGIMSTGLVKAVLSGSLAAGFSGIAKALALVKAAAPELLIVAAAIGAVTLAYKKYKEAHPSFDDLKQTASTAKSEADEAKRAYENATEQIKENKEKLKELQKLASNGTITRAQQAEISNLTEQNEKYNEQLAILERKAALAKEAADAAQREAANAKFNEMFSSAKPSASYLPGGWDRAGGDAKLWLGGRVPETINAKEKVDELIGAYRYSMDEVRVITDNIREGLESDSEEVKKKADSMIHDLDIAKGKLEDTRKAVVDYANDLYTLRDMYNGLDDEESLKHVAEIDELLDKINRALPKTDKSLASFKSNLELLDSTIKKKLSKDINSLTKDDLEAFERWLGDCGYSVKEFQDLLRDLSDEMRADTPANTYTSKQISEWGTMTDEIRKAQAALEDYQEAMKGGNNDEMAKAAQTAWQTAMEDIASGRIDSKAVWAFAELAMSPQQLAELSYDAERIANVIKSSLYSSLFDDDNAENGFSDKDNKYGYGQRLLKMLEERQGELPGVKVWRDAAGGIQYTIDDFDELAKQLKMSSGMLDILLHDLETYGKELLTDTTQNTKLVESLQYYISNITDAKEATRQFIREAFKNDTNLKDSTMWRILNGLHEQGHLNLEPSAYYDLIQEVRDGLEAEGAEEDLTVQPRADDTLLVEDIDSMLENCQKLLDQKTLKAHIEADSNDTETAADNIDNSPEAVAARNEELRKQLEEDAAFYEAKIRDLYGTLGDLADETGSVREAVRLLVDQLRGIGVSDEEIDSILESFRGMGLAIIPTLEDIDTEAAELQGTLDGLDGTDARPQVNLNTSNAYRAMQSMVNDLNAITQRTWTVQLAAGVYGTASKVTDEGKTWRSRAKGGVTGKAGPTLVNELGPELISDRGRAFIANSGQPGFVNLSKDAIVFNADETREIAKNGGFISGASAYADGTRKGLIGRLLSGDVPARANTWVCKICGSRNDPSATKCWNCKNAKGASNTAAAMAVQKAQQQTTTTVTPKVTSTSKTVSDILADPGKSVKTTTTSTTWWYCSNCGRANPSTSSRCEYCGTSKNGTASGLITKGVTSGTKLATTTAADKKSQLYPSVQSANYNELFNFGDGGGAGGGGGGGGAASESRSNPQKIDWIAVKLNRIQREISDLETVASSGLKKLSTRLDSAKKEASKLNEEIDIAQRGYDRYIQEANSVGLSADLAEKVRNGAIDINEYEDEELRQKISEYQEWYEKALQCASAVEELNQQIGELYRTNFDLVQEDYANQLSLIEHEMSMINADIAMAQAKGMLDSASYYERLAQQETNSISKMKAELSDLERYFNEAMSSGKIEENSAEWYAMKQEILGVKEAIADANVQLQEYQNTIRSIKWSYFDYAQDRFSDLAQEAEFLISLLENSKLFDDRGQFNNSGYATLGMRAINFDAYMSQADAYAQEMQKIESEIASDPYNQDLIDRRMTLLQLQRQSILAAEQEKVAVRSLVQEGIQIELESLQELIDAYKDSLDSAKSLYDYQKKVSEKSQGIASIQKQLAAYQNDTSEETRAKIQKLNKDLEKAQTDLAETEREQSISDQKKLLDDVYTEYEELVNQRLDDIDLLMKEMIAAANANADKISNEINVTANEVGYTLTDGMQAAMNGHYANYDRIFDGISGATTVLTRIYDNVNAMARAAGAVKAYAKGGLIDYTGLAAVHGTPGNPELVLSAADTEKFLQAAQMMQTMQNLRPVSGRELSALMYSGGGGSSVGDITLNIDIERVLDYNDFVTQLQADPKFERLIDTMTTGRMLGGSRLAKNGIRF